MIPINVKERIETGVSATEGYSAWTSKHGVISVRPPVDILKSMYTIRIHLDKTTAENGAFHVYPKFHFGILDQQKIEQIRQSKTSVCCEVDAGGVHLMKPLTLHYSSQKTINAQPRKVIHLRFASAELLNGLEWEERE